MWIAVGIALSFLITILAVVWIIWHLPPPQSSRTDHGPYPTMTGQMKEYERKQREKGYEG